MIKAKIKMMLKNVGEKLVYMSDKLCNVKTVTVTGTTNSNGAFSLASVTNYKNGDEVLSVATNTDANALCIPWVYSKDNWYVSVVNWQSWAQKANTSFTFTVRYKVGGVLRNLSIFKAFRHFMSLQKGGGIDVQTGSKKITGKIDEKGELSDCFERTGKSQHSCKRECEIRIQQSDELPCTDYSVSIFHKLVGVYYDVRLGCRRHDIICYAPQRKQHSIKRSKSKRALACYRLTLSERGCVA